MLQHYNLQLPLTKLHYVSGGRGEPLIIVPATISEIDNWAGLIEFLGQKFTTYFFELPGHGNSTPFNEPYSSELVAQTVKDFIGVLGYSGISLMGFSFGGILALKVLEQLGERVERVILYAPCVAPSALKYSASKLLMLRQLLKPVRSNLSQKVLLSLMHSPQWGGLIVDLIKKLGNIENSEVLKQKLLHLRPATLDVLGYQIDEIFQTDFSKVWSSTSNVPCYFGMSHYDPLLDFEKTRSILRNHFVNYHEAVLDLPYHNPPQPLQLTEMNRDYSQLLALIM